MGVTHSRRAQFSAISGHADLLLRAIDAGGIALKKRNLGFESLAVQQLAERQNGVPVLDVANQVDQFPFAVFRFANRLR